MRSRAALGRVTMLSAVALLVGGAVHPASLDREFPDRPQDRLNVLQAQSPTMAGPTAHLRSTESGSSIMPSRLPFGLASTGREDEADALEPGTVLEVDRWTMLAGSLGLMLFVAMRRL